MSSLLILVTLIACGCPRGEVDPLVTEPTHLESLSVPLEYVRFTLRLPESSKSKRDFDRSFGRVVDRKCFGADYFVSEAVCGDYAYRNA